MSEQNKNHVNESFTDSSEDEGPSAPTMLSCAAVAAPPSILMSAAELMHEKEDEEAAEYRSALPPMSHTSAYMGQSDEDSMGHFRDLPINATLPAGIAPFTGLNGAEDDDDSDVKWRSLDVGLANIDLKPADATDVYADDSRGAIFDAASLMSATTAAVNTTLCIRQLPPYPFFLERDHFYSMLKDEELMERIRDTLAAFDVDSTFTADPCCWTSVVYNGAKYANFKAKIFKVDSDKDGLKVVEFQRRQGDCFVFKHMFRSLVNDLCRGQVVCSKDKVVQAAKPANEVAPLRSFVPLPFSFGGEEEEEQALTVEAATDSIKPLERMVTSEYSDIAQEGATAMASLLCKSDEASVRDTAVYAQVPGLLESISKVARDSGGHISRCAAMCICACAEAASKATDQSTGAAVQQKIVDSSALETLVTLAQGGECVLIETQRQALRGLVTMARSHAASILAMGSQEMLANVEKCAESDLRLGMHLSKLKEVFAALHNASSASSE